MGKLIVTLRDGGEELARVETSGGEVTNEEVQRLLRRMDEEFCPIIEQRWIEQGRTMEVLRGMVIRLSVGEVEELDPYSPLFVDPGWLRIERPDGVVVHEGEIRTEPRRVSDSYPYRLLYIDEEGRPHYIDLTTGQQFTTSDVDNEPVEFARYDPSFGYYAHDPAQVGHGRDGGVPMTLEELIGAEGEKVDRGEEEGTMRLRKECEHGRYDAHFFSYERIGGPGYDCPGGEFLPEGALVIEKVDGKWPDTAHLVARRWKASNDGTHHLLDALASQVGESE